MLGSDRNALQRPPPAVAVLFEPRGPDVATDRSPPFLHPLDDLPPRQVRPLHFQPHRIARSVVLEHLLESHFERRVEIDQPFASTPFFRERPVSRSSAPSSSPSPIRMVLGSHPKTPAIYSIPPCPNFAASMAAYRRRSFSLSESNSLLIIRLTSNA